MIELKADGAKTIALFTYQIVPPTPDTPITDPARLLTVGNPEPCFHSCCQDWYTAPSTGWIRPTRQPITDPARLLKGKHEPYIYCAGHLRQGFDPEQRKTTIDNVVRVLKFYDFDAIAFTGLSGALVAPTVALMLDKTLLAVRKNEQCHSSQQVEGDFHAKRYVILDDFIASGSTVRRIMEEIQDEISSAHCIGVVEYAYVYAESDWKEVMKQVAPCHNGVTILP